MLNSTIHRNSFQGGNGNYFGNIVVNKRMKKRKKNARARQELKRFIEIFELRRDYRSKAKCFRNSNEHFSD